MGGQPSRLNDSVKIFASSPTCSITVSAVYDVERRPLISQNSLRDSSRSRDCSEFLRPAMAKEARHVLQLYNRNPIANMEVVSIEIVQNATLKQSFDSRMTRLQDSKWRTATGAAPSWTGDRDVSTRSRVYQRFLDLASPFFFPMYASLKFLPVWRRAHADELHSLMEVGYKLGNDNHGASCRGFSFSQGVTGAVEAKYAWQIRSDADGREDEVSDDDDCSNEDVLVLNWVGLARPYPVLGGDSSKLLAKAKFSHDGLFIPLGACSKGKATGKADFRPVRDQETPIFTKVCIFDPSQCLPSTVLRLRERK